MIIPRNILEVFQAIEETTNPVSIFVYGSRAREDFRETSDFEVGVLFEREKKLGRSELRSMHSIDILSLYPFVYEDFIAYNPDTPFPKAIYMRELIDEHRL